MTSPLLSNKAYDTARLHVQKTLPGIGAAYFALAQIWHLPFAEEVVGTCAIIATFLGILISVATRRYEESGAKYDGAIVTLPQEDGGIVYSFEMEMDPYEISERDSLTVKVIPRR